MDTTVADTLIGTTIDGRYRITGRVARGGMATVYTAVDDRLERTVALKIIHPSQATNVHFVDRFTDEAKTIARLTHPNVVAVYDQGRHQGLPYLVMEFVQGRTLRDLLTQRRRLNPVEALAILEQMLAAIAAAHRAGLVHRDVKPENVLVAEAPSGGIANLVDSVVKVADFGLARAVEASATDDTGQLMATVAYVAPELVTDGHADARTDVYSAGIVLFEMLTGRVPYDGDEPVEVAWQHVDNDVPPPSSIVKGLPTVLDDLVARATRRDPGARPTDAGALLAEVQVVRDDLGAANVETALLRQVPARPPAADATALVPTVTTVFPQGTHGSTRPTWARLPEQGARGHGQRRAGGPPSAAPVGGLIGKLGGDRRRILILAAVALMILTVIGSTWWVTLGRYTDAPQLVGGTRAQAEQAAASEGFELRVGDGAFSENVPKDVVLSQDPPASERVIKGGILTVSLSLGPERYPVPDIVGMEASAARGEIEGSKLKFKEGTGKYSDTVPQGVVISVDPKVAAQLKPGSTVTVVISKGRAPITVPDFKGKNINDARGQAQQLGLSVVEQYTDSDQPADQVIEQSPKPGTGAEKDDEIKLKVSKGPPLVNVPDVNNQPCPQAQQTLQAQNLRARLDFNPNGTVRIQNPAPGTQVPPQTEVVLTCA
ncbi:Stk1 family PASTA domain-containing Ser/Thr kinase [Actinoplanes friuliensis]|jgi:eukaryotic-like serine/threonine-protein kinase|uniref:non-specific serine/threonine protein kinase n=1 Tax=Actinoplanes friuliensis DSM 7358 TaxID=1246995 RepID=U5VTU0_9ACTN|nr:Stk1 family PASTA domain-containing Ser/Thr kinase [Actinoplanes friuliensis]AGZ40227.1 putative serine/threonine protein kinase [Actinoplanes friuliensis DSM 7358]